MELSNSIFAWDSVMPIFGGCQPTIHHNIFVPAAAAFAGDRNQTAEPLSLFVDLLVGNYHLRPTSVARGAGEAGTNVPIDFDGNLRPNPTGSNPDIGAFEAP
jgi:hypothetical protein